MFEISEQLILEQSDEIFGVSQISWEDSPWKQLSLVNDEEVISLSHAKVYVFSDSVLKPWKDAPEPTIKYCLGRKVDVVQEFITIRSFGHEWNIFPGFTTLQLCSKVQEFLSKMSVEPQ